MYKMHVIKRQHMGAVASRRGSTAWCNVGGGNGDFLVVGEGVAVVAASVGMRAAAATAVGLLP